MLATVAAFFLGNWKRMAALILLFVVVSVWIRFQLYEAQHKADEAALAHTRQMLATAQAQARVNEMATRAADHTQRVNDLSRAHVSDAQHAIAAAEDAHSYYVAWVAGINSVRDAAAIPA